MSFLSRLINVFRSDCVDDDLQDELRFHLDSRIDDLVAGGLSRTEAEREAARRFGHVLRVRESSRDVKLLPWLESLVQDARFGMRLLRRDGSVTAAAVLSLGLAIGACTAAFSLVDALILRHLPVPEPERLIYLASRTRESFTYPLYQRLRTAAADRADLFLMSAENRRPATFAGSSTREEVRVQFVSGNAFGSLGVQPAAGRLLSTQDDLTPGAHAVAVLSHAFWSRRFGLDPSVVGRNFALGDRSFQIVGVAESRFSGIEPGRVPDLWMPAMMYDPKAFSAPYWHWFRILGRLKPGADPRPLEDVLQATLSAYQQEHVGRVMRPDSPKGQIDEFLKMPLDVRSAANGPSSLRTQFERPLWVLAAVVCLVLLIAASNVANVFLARAAAREREMSLRLSVGAARGRLIQQVLVESALLAMLACVVGLVFALVAGPAVVRLLAPVAEPIYLELRLDWRLIGFLALVGSTTAILFGLIPAVRASGVAPIGALNVNAPRQSSPAGLLRPLVAVQVAFSLVVLFAAGLLLLSFGRLTHETLGFQKNGIHLLALQQRELNDPNAQRLAGLQVREQIRGLPGVDQASLASWPLFTGGGWTGSVRIPGRAPDSQESVILPVSAGFFDTLRIPLLDGRDFEARDTEPEQPLGVIVNEAFAHRYFGNARAVGQRFNRVGQNRLLPQEVVGLVADAKYSDVRLPAPPTIYLPHRGLGTLFVRSDLDAPALATLIREAVPRAHPSLSVSTHTLQSTLVENTLLRERLLALLSGFFAVVGLLLSAIGLYGVLTHSVVRRTKELGIRVALGARPASLIRSIVHEAVLMTSIGIVAGLAGGLYVSRFLKSLLFEVEPWQAPSIFLPVGSLLLVAAVAAALPAWRAVRTDPLVALRQE
jgi:putative ABC transport system permease protein